MDAKERHQHLRELWLRARELAPDAREGYLDRTCADDGDLRRELELLLEHDERPIAFAEATSGSTGDGAPAPLPQSIGGFRIERKLGEGGMGTVFQAQQERPRRTVALKVLRSTVLSHEAVRRFEHECEFLGRLQHPGIAQIYDSGQAQTERGQQSWFAMELIGGEPLTSYACSHALSARERLALLARVADAVQHAHQQGVIHRDLKPENILVTAAGQPKILDFGIARASDSDVQLSTLQTDVGQILGTLAYMSPEQASGDPAAIDTRSDVYQLGLLAFELLANELPYDISQKSLPDSLRVIQETEPRRLSTTGRGASDVDTILSTALEKDKERRYASAAALAADIRHYLRDEPITARPASRLYTLGKFVRRNRVAVLAGLAVLLSLIAGLVASLRFGFGELRQRRQVLRLSALQDVEDLIARADALWPLRATDVERYAEWIDDAHELVAQLPEHRAVLDELREEARPRTPAEDHADRARHPSYADLEWQRGRIESQRTALLQRKGGRPAPLPDVDWNDYPEDAWSLSALAYERVQPGRVYPGEEALGLALALRAHELAAPDFRAETGETLAWAYFAVGRDADAQSTIQAVLREAQEPNERLERTHAELKDAIAAARSAEAETLLAEAMEACATLEAEVGRRQEWHFSASESDPRWWNNQLVKLIAELEALERDLLAQDAVSPEHGWSMPKRHAFALDLRNAQRAGGEHAVRWSAMLPAIRKAYPEVAMVPQSGLLPLGPDPASGLWEFAHVASGVPAARDEPGRLVLTEDTGLVLVLLPAGRFRMGCQRSDTQLPNHDPSASRYDGPVHEVQVTPFFVSKYEMTQGQWLRLTGHNPSRDEPANYKPAWNAAGLPGNLLHPVEQISWPECLEVCTRFELALPTEAQWEYAARGGGSTVWWTGDDPTALQHAANLADAYCLEHEGDGTWTYEPWDDGNTSHARVGGYAANAFGLHDVVGNVWEWCSDGYDESVYARPRAIDPFGDRSNSDFRIRRGGSFDETAARSRSAMREIGTLGLTDYDLGLRPARPLKL
ncbi:MAG: SUMF1/EgtB/PvdO family nonheme iron enzyme [bacterium]|nr:SUMF1/EgtB/PvdO family nonheme iron enzyme [bacterium]